MSLFNLTPAEINAKTIDQLVSFFGNGKLLDQSTCSIQLRDFLAAQANDKLAEYAKYCLESKFDKSGQVLQDVVNEIGRRLGYEVESGRYAGSTRSIGFDGLWNDGMHTIVAEVKTTDAYRINLDTIAAYARRLEVDRQLAASSLFVLIVVGRQDTGDLEAQVRGSRHAWSIRLVSVDALIKLMFVREELDDKALLGKIQKVLLPIEYTRVDSIVDLVFETQQEADQKAHSEDELVDSGPTPLPPSEGYEFTPTADLEKKRASVLNSFFDRFGALPHRVSKTNYEDPAKGLRATCAVSKRYKRDSQPYWYALHPQWVEFLRKAPSAYFILSCMDSDEAYALPLSLIEQHLEELNRTEKGDRTYWHIALQFVDGRLSLNLSKVGKKVDLTPFAFAVSGQVA